MKKKWLALLGALLVVTHINCQEEGEPKIPKQKLVHASVGALWNVYTANGEFEFFLRDKGRVINPYLAAGIGISTINKDVDSYLMGKLGMLIGMDKHYCEMSTGVELALGEERLRMIPTYGIGYRYQNIDKRIMLRVGLGLPEGFYIGAGTFLGKTGKTRKGPVGDAETFQGNLLLHGAVGLSHVLYFSAIGYLEFRLNETRKIVDTYVRGGFGREAHWGEGGFYMLGQLGTLVGKTKHRLEASAGGGYILNGDLEGWIPSGTIGYRCHKLGGKHLFRLGVGFPEAIYFGVGVALK